MRRRILRRRKEKVLGEKSMVTMRDLREGSGKTKGEVEEMRNNVGVCSTGTSTGGFTYSTPRSTQTEDTPSPSQVYPQTPGTPPFPDLTAPHTPSHTPKHTTPFMPPFTTPYTPIWTPFHTAPPAFHTPPYIPPLCGSTPGLQWLFCGGCQAWGFVSPTT